MPRLTVRGKNPEDGGGWQPLPDGTYEVQIDGIEQTTSRKGNAQLKMSGHVVGGAHDQKKVTVWYALVENALWKLENLCEAACIDYEVNELDENDPETGKPLVEFDFDTDDLPGCIVVYDVKKYTHEGKEQNRFEGERAPDGGADQSSSSAGNSSAPDEEPEPDEAPEPEPEPEPEEKPQPAARGRRARRARA